MLVSDVTPDWLPIARLKGRVELPETACVCEIELGLVEDSSELCEVEISRDDVPCDASLEDAPAIDWTDEVPLSAIAVVWL